ncbi:hypothetical protein PO124_02495 [Bacillus licheniformis]|nr:hypothetical protein [Bacillus licheniformis]
MAHVQDHRAERIERCLRERAFPICQTLNLNKDEFREAINLSHTVKPNRYTYLHEAGYREKRFAFLMKIRFCKKYLSRPSLPENALFAVRRFSVGIR